MDELRAVLTGGSVSSDNVFIDSLVKKDKSLENFVPRVRQTVTYIACSVLINEQNEILMVQEAKQSCRGKWYLPAGCMENNETIEAAAKREVLEESGLTYEPTTLVCVEALRYSWIRFTLTGTITGGVLKVLNPLDTESLQAQWFDVTTIQSSLNVRASDIFPLINETLRRRSLSESICRNILPTNCPHNKMLLRLIAVQRTTDGKKEERQVLVSLSGHTHLPTAVFQCIDATTHNLLQNAFKTPVEQHVLGVVSVEHDGRPAHVHDGMCLTLLLTLDGTAASRDSVQIADKKHYGWLTVTDADIIEHLDGLSVGLVALRG